ncbi:MAG TPA: endonuclease/exonuclease/phosphatase family protein, partial [Pyrinomonadaceae bacterium]|nr:endonuclease/exonuclease/phosphatase family protein [Pyrinomonadaceae bacterium]
GADGLDFYESLEGMLVRVNSAVAVGPSITRRDSKDVVVIGDGGAGAGLRTARGGIIIRPGDFNPERITLVGDASQIPDVNVGDRFDGPVTGVLDYSFGNFRVLLTGAAGVSARGIRPETAPAPGRDQLAVAAFNVQNLDPGDDDAKFSRLAGIVVHNLRSPDLISVEEIQDNNGSVNDAEVDATQTFRKLVAAIRAAGGPAYDFRDIPPVDDQDGGEPGGNIRVGFLFRTDRGLRFVARPGGGPTVATRVVGATGNPRLSSSPGRLDPANPAFAESRKPLAGEFTFRGRRLFVIANHFASKGGDNPLFGRFQPPERATEPKRIQQAQVVAAFVRQILARDRRARVIALGDLNDFEFSAPLAALKGAGLTALIERLPRNERYTYVFEGNSQTLDHILVSRGLLGALASFDVVHINSEFFDQASDHDPTVAVFTFR